MLALLGLFSAVMLVALYFSAKYLAKSAMGKKLKPWHTLAIAASGYAVVAVVVCLNFKDM